MPANPIRSPGTLPESTATTTTTAQATPNSSATNSAGANRGSQPVVSTQTKSRTNFFDIFLSEKTIKRNQKHAEIMDALKTYKEVEKQLIEINKKLDDLIETLSVATGRKTKSLLSVAADDANTALTQYDSLLKSLDANNAPQQLSDTQIQNFRQHSSALDKKLEMLNDRWKETSNISEDIKIKFEKVWIKSKRVSNLHKAVVNRYPALKVSSTQRQGNAGVNVDGTDVEDSVNEIDDDES